MSLLYGQKDNVFQSDSVRIKDICTKNVNRHVYKGKSSPSLKITRQDDNFNRLKKLTINERQS